jgi:hypothetical protein
MEETMDIQVTTIISVVFKSKGKFIRRLDNGGDGEVSWHEQGYVCNAETGARLGPGMFICPKDSDNFAINKLDFEYATRPGTICKYIVFDNPKTRKQIAVTIERAIEIVEKCQILGTDKKEFYLIYLWDITGEQPESLF